VRNYIPRHCGLPGSPHRVFGRVRRAFSLLQYAPDDARGFGRAGAVAGWYDVLRSQKPPMPATSAMHCSKVTKLQLVEPLV
jgi:hypothetical protein